MKRFAYADPPYLGLAARHYAEHHPDAAAYDSIDAHKTLIDRLASDYDGFALSMTTPNLRQLLPLLPEDVRICAWVKPFAAFKANVTQAYAWEPVAIRPVRKPSRYEMTVRDWVSVPITLARGLVGAKPEALAIWIFEFAGLLPEDEFEDVFPGSGAVGAAWQRWRDQTSFQLRYTAEQSRNAMVELFAEKETPAD